MVFVCGTVWGVGAMVTFQVKLGTIDTIRRVCAFFGVMPFTANNACDITCAVLYNMPKALAFVATNRIRPTEHRAREIINLDLLVHSIKDSFPNLLSDHHRCLIRMAIFS